MNKVIRAEQDYWRGQKRVLQEELEEDGGPVTPKRIRGEVTRDNDTDDEILNSLGPLTADKGSVSQLHSRNKVVPKTRIGIWETMKFLLSGGQGGLRPGSSEAKIAENQKKRNLLKNHGIQDKATGY